MTAEMFCRPANTSERAGKQQRLPRTSLTDGGEDTKAPTNIQGVCRVSARQRRGFVPW